MKLCERILELFSPERSSVVDQTPSLLFDKFGEPSSSLMRMAVGLLLIEVAEADLCITEDEISTIWSALDRHLALRQTAANELMGSLTEMRADRTQINRTMQTLKERLSSEQLELVMIMAWRVVLADGRIDDREQILFERFGQRFEFDLQTLEDLKAEARKGSD